MITFGAKYVSPVNIGEITKKKEVVPYRAAITEFIPDDIRDTSSLNFLVNFSLRRTNFARSIFEDYLVTENGQLYNKNWVRFLTMNKEQDSYKYVKTRNILGVAEISSSKIFPNDIYLDYLQTIKNWFVQKYCYVGTGFLNFIKKSYPDKDITLQALRSAVKFYENNGFVVTNSPKDNGLVEMRYSHK